MRTKHQDFEDTYPTQPGGLPQRQPLTGGFGRGGACPANLPAEACTDLGTYPEPRVIRRFLSLYIAAMVVAAIAGAASLAGCTAIPRLPF